MKKPTEGDIVKFDGQFVTITGTPIIRETVYFALKGQDGVNTAVPYQAVEWNGKQFVVNPDKVTF